MPNVKGCVPEPKVVLRSHPCQPSHTQPIPARGSQQEGHLPLMMFVQTCRARSPRALAAFLLSMRRR